MSEGFAGFLESARPDPGEGRSLGEVLNAPARRSWYDEGDPEPADLDEKAANLMARGYAAGGTSMLAQRYADTVAELETVREANEKARKAQARIARDHNAGRITAADIMRMSFDEPDLRQEEKLERRVTSLRGQLEEMSARVVPQHQAADPVEEAGRQAHQAYVEATRATLAGTRPIPQGPRPFAGRGGVAVRSEVTCAECAEAGATPDESFLIHSDPWPPVSDAPPPAADNEATVRARELEVERLVELGFSRDIAREAATPLAKPYCRRCGVVPEWCRCSR